MENVHMCIKAAFFDVDGVLIDSLADHLNFCKDINDEYNLNLAIPSVEDFKKSIRDGVRVSPMELFFKAVGFPDESAKKADLKYQKEFSDKYKQHPFNGVAEMLQKLTVEGLTLGIVTANVMNIVVESLGENIRFFDPNFCFMKDSHGYESKAEALKAAATRLGINADNLIYVGDQIGDYEAAINAGVKFLGVTYGWGISEIESEFQVVKSCSEVAESIIKMV